MCVPTVWVYSCASVFLFSILLKTVSAIFLLCVAGPQPCGDYPVFTSYVLRRERVTHAWTITAGLHEFWGFELRSSLSMVGLYSLNHFLGAGSHLRFWVVSKFEEKYSGVFYFVSEKSVCLLETKDLKESCKETAKAIDPCRHLCHLVSLGYLCNLIVEITLTTKSWPQQTQYVHRVHSNNTE